MPYLVRFQSVRLYENTLVRSKTREREREKKKKKKTNVQRVVRGLLWLVYMSATRSGDGYFFKGINEQIQPRSAE